MDIRWLGHSAFLLEDGGTRVLIDPFLSGNPKAAVSADEVEADVILLTHGHQDHIGDTVDIARRTGAPVVAIVEVANELSRTSARTTRYFEPTSAARSSSTGLGQARPAWHTGMTPRAPTTRRPACVILLRRRSSTTSATPRSSADLQLVAHRGDQIDVALMCIAATTRWTASTP
jgi:L-ascorbate metabolism protein UlaG (beta-lactamase superfamily)